MPDTPAKSEVQDYWNRHPAGAAEVAHLRADRTAYFDERDRQTATQYPFLDRDYDFAAARHALTLELGCGMGYNAQQLARAGARLVAIDLAPQAVALTRERFQLRGLEASFLVADAENLPFKRGAFDRVYSSGVIHHSPSTAAAGREIVRVLRSGGHATVMIYHRDSIWYWWNIRLVLGALMWLLNALPPALREPLLRRMPHWRDLLLPPGQRLTVADIVRAGTDFGGLQNPLSRVYTRQTAAALFPGLTSFRFVTQNHLYDALNDKPGLFTRLARAILTPLDRIWGWFLIVHADKP